MISHDGETLFVLFPVERLVAQHVVGVAHFDDAQLSGDIVSAALHDKMHHAVREVVLNTVLTELLVVFTGHLTDEERRQLKSANGFEKTEDFIAWVFHFCEGEEGSQRVEDQEFKPNRLAVRRQLLDELPHPVHSVAHALFVELDTQVGQIDDGNSVSDAGVIDVHAHVGHV